MAHIFSTFIRTDWNNMDRVSIVIDKNTKKAVKEAIVELDELLKVNYRIVSIDATAVTNEACLAMIVAYSLYKFRNIEMRDFRAVKIETVSIDAEKLNDAYRDIFEDLKNTGGTWETYAAKEGVDWLIINALINEGIEDFITRLSVVQTKYRIVIEKTVESRIQKDDFNRRWNFKTRQTNLFQLYKDCFDEIEQILAPHSCYNPNPSFQRDLVWSEEKKQQFILSIINEIPIGAFYVNRSKTTSNLLALELGEGFGGLVWDGKQRLHAMDDFIQGKFSIMLGGKMVSYLEYSGFFNVKFGDCSIMMYESSFDTVREIIEAYVVINSAQVKHTDEDLKKAIDYLEEQGEVS